MGPVNGAVLSTDQATLERRADGYADKPRQRWNVGAGPAWVAAARCSIGCSSRSPIDSPIGQPRVVPISCPTLAADGKHYGGDRAPDGNHGAMRRRRHLGMLSAARAGDTEGVTATLICANAQTYAFEPESFDLIVSRFGTGEPAARRASTVLGRREHLPDLLDFRARHLMRRRARTGRLIFERTRGLPAALRVKPTRRHTHGPKDDSQLDTLARPFHRCTESAACGYRP
jgi:hypothetical protein